MGTVKMRKRQTDNLELKSSIILEFLKFNRGVNRYNVNKREWIKLEKMTKSQLEINISVTIQFFTGLRMNEVVKLSNSQLKDISNSKRVRVELSKSKETKKRVIEINPKEKHSKRLKRELVKMIKEWLKFKQPFLVVSKNMSPKEKLLKKKNGKQYTTFYYPYINNFNSKVNKKLRDFKEYKESRDEEFLPNHIEKLTTHSFRNNFIVMLYKATNNDLSKTKTIIQHSDIKLTDRYITKYIANDTSVLLF